MVSLLDSCGGMLKFLTGEFLRQSIWIQIRSTTVVAPKSASEPRTTLSVLPSKVGRIEFINGGQHCWRFRPHFHAGDEIVHLLAGRARLYLRDKFYEVSAGDTVVVPAGFVHRFAPVDEEGWSFISEFAVQSPSPRLGYLPDDRSSLAAQAASILARRKTLQSDLDEIAAACSISPRYLSRRFRKEVGTSVHNFHSLLAIHRAKTLLRGQASLVEAALDAGFYDQAHLTREFVRTFGMTPGTFRSAWRAAA